MPTYNFTSDLRISVLPSRLKVAANEIINNDYSSDKSASNNRATLAFYFNLIEGTNTLRLAAMGKITEVIRNFVVKFQYPNTYTAELFEANVKDGTLVAPLRETIKILAYQRLVKNEILPFLTFDEIRYFIFCNPKVWLNATASSYASVIETIMKNRSQSHDYTTEINQLISWKQYERQSRELISIIPYACDCFKVSNGKITLSMPNPLDDKYVDTLHFLSSVLKQNEYWTPESNVYNSELKESYTSYMDINGNIEYCRQSRPLFVDLDKPLQLIYYGAPGTGKSFTIDRDTNEDNSVRTTFHPDSDYAGFVGAYKPTMKHMPITVSGVDSSGKGYAKFVNKDDNHPGTERKIVYKYVPQAFLKAYVEAWKRYVEGEDNPYYLVIEEINRGNCAQIFGDLFQLLDRNNARSSSYAINADEDIAQFLREEAFKKVESGKEKVESGGLTQEQWNNIEKFELVKDSGNREHIGPSILNGSKLLLPPNLRIWATMNTSDQSLFPIDSAFKRRWNWEYMPIEYNKKDWTFVVGNKRYSWGQFLEKINPKILDLTMSEDKQMGYFFAKPDIKSKEGLKENDTISEKMLLNKVLFYMWTDVFKDYDLTMPPFVRKVKNKEGKEINKPYRFTEFFGENGTKNLVGFIEGIEGLTPIEEDTENIQPDDIKDTLSDGTKLLFKVNGGKSDAITWSLHQILKPVVDKYTYAELSEKINQFIHRNIDIIKPIDNPNTYTKEDNWLRHYLTTSDGVNFVITNQWKREYIPMIKELADDLGIEFEQIS